MFVRIKLENDVDLVELRKVLCFVSEDIVSVNICDKEIELELVDASDKETIVSAIEKLVPKYKIRNNEAEDMWNNYRDKCHFFMDIINNRKLFYVFGDGLLGLRGKAIFLYEYFEKSFAKLADEMGALRKFYPVLLPVKGYLKTGYIDRSPQYAIFCSNAYENLEKLEGLSGAVRDKKLKDELDEPRLALSPSACFHVYIEYQGTTLERNTVVSFTQSVFRNEGRLNYDEVGRLMDYHVREIVFIGSDDYVRKAREDMLKKTKYLLEKWGLQARIKCASDSFILPKMQKYRNIQLIDSSKYEVCLRTGKECELAAGSFNYHGTAFTYPFAIQVLGCTEAVTGCVGFGIERWVLAFLMQFGSDHSNWPKCIQEEYVRRWGNEGD